MIWRALRRASVVGLTLVLIGVPAAEAEVAYLALEEGSPYWQVWVMNPDGTERRQVTRSVGDKSRCSWAPGGKRLLVNTLDGNLYWVEVASGEEERIEISDSGMTDAFLSRDGRYIAYSVSPPNEIDKNQVWVVQVDGTGAQQLTSMPGFQQQPAWGEDGDWIYFLASQGEGLQRVRNVWRVSLDKVRLEQVTNESRFSFTPAVGPKNRLAYSSNRSGNYELYAQSADGTDVARWTDHPDLDSSPTWSPSGNALVFHSVRSGRPQIYRIDAPGGEAQPLTDHTGGARDPVWYPGQAGTQ